VPVFTLTFEGRCLGIRTLSSGVHVGTLDKIFSPVLIKLFLSYVTFFSFDICNMIKVFIL
jgi:hypothetical protein